MPLRALVLKTTVLAKPWLSLLSIFLVLQEAFFQVPLLQSKVI